jgi:hypothetical protein
MTKIKKYLKISGLIILAAGVIVGFANIKGWFKNSTRLAIIEWAKNTNTGLPISHPSAQAFMKDFPPPSDTKIEEITHLTKTVIRSASGGQPMNVSINYMLNDHSRTSNVATLADLERWASNTVYPWIAWTLSFVGFIEILSSSILEMFFVSTNNC